MTSAHKIRVYVAVLINLVIAAIHAFRMGTYLEGSLYILYYSFFSDIVIPFGIYFLLAIYEVNVSFLRKWWVKGAIVFGFSTLSEILQAFGIYMLGVTFDPLDILMFGIGVGLAMFLDLLIFNKYLYNWKIQ